MLSEQKRVCVVGGGAAGMMAAGTALSYGAQVTVFEATDRLGKKLAITGKGRCNITNRCTIDEFLENVTKNPRFLYAALSELDPESTVSFFNSLGVETKTERGRRVFPCSDKAKDVVDAMRAYCSGAKTVYEKVLSVSNKEDGSFLIKTGANEYLFDAVIIATGGRSYPLTGSDGSGYRLAQRLGHKVTALIPSLVPIESDSDICKRLQGLSLKNVKIIITEDDKKIYSDFGEMMFTHFGVTGPIILSASSRIRDRDISNLLLHINFKPALDYKTLDQRLIGELNQNANKDFINSLGSLLPQKLIEPFIENCGIDKRKKSNAITKEERRIMVERLTDFIIPLKKLRPIDEAIITSGGIEVKEITPKTMESKIHKNLFFAGEIIDVDAYTGGYNLQIAFSTGYLAGKFAAE